MNKSEYIEFHSDFCEKMKTVTREKNSDYTGNGDDPFANFSTTPIIAGVSVLQGFLVRMGDKMARVKSFSQKGSFEVKDESIQDTLLDLANYCVLAAGQLKASKDVQSNS